MSGWGGQQRRQWVRRGLALALLVGGALGSAGWVRAQGAQPAPLVITALIDGGITGNTSDYLESALHEAEEAHAQALLIELDTPGGMLDATRRIVRAMLAAKVPVITYVSPSGARAGSAGLFLVLASNVAVMNATSNIGAAHPVTALGEDVKGDMGDKVLNDTAAWARSLAQTRGRNVEWAEKAVKESASLTAQEAIEQKVVDLLSPDVPTLLRAVDGRMVTVADASFALHTAGASVRAFERTGLQQFYEVLSNPSLLFLLMILGIFGIYIEFNHPGLIVPGLLGAVCLGIVFGLQILPVNWFGAALIAASAVLFVAEVYVTSFGLLGLSGLACLIAGSYILFSVPGSVFHIDRVLIWIVSAAFAAVLLLLGGMILRARRSGPKSGPSTLIGSTTQVVQAAAPGENSRVFLEGTFWNAISTEPLVAGQAVVVVGLEGLTLQVRAVAGETAEAEPEGDAGAPNPAQKI